MSRARVFWGIGIVVVLAAAGMVAAKYYMEHQWRQELDQRLAKLQPLNVTYEGLRVSLPFYRTHIANIRMTGQAGRGPVTVREVVVERMDLEHRVPHYLHARVVGLEESLENVSGSTGNLFQKYGYQKIHADYEIDYQYDADAKVMEVRRLIADLDRIGRLEASLSLRDFHLYESSKNATPAPDFSLAGGRLTYTDASLVDRILEEAAREQGMTKQAYLQAVDKQLDEAVSKESDARMKAITAQLKIFLDKPGRLHVAINPEKPVTLPQLFAKASVSPAELPSLLALDVRAE